jgi:uncharacterized protein YjbI with pentapeptide repeats
MTRDFSNQDLRGQDFRGQDLSQANFSGADIRGANFTKTNLKDANFSDAKSGLQKRYIAIQVIVACLMCGTCGILVGYFSSWFSFYFETSYINKYGLRPGISYVYSLGMIIFAILYHGFTTKALINIAISNILVVACATIIGVTSTETYESASIAVVGIATLSIGVAVGVSGFSTSSICIATRSKIVKYISVLMAVSTGILGGVFGGLAGSVSGASKIYDIVVGDISTACAITVAIVPSLLSIYIAWRVIKSDPKFSLTHRFSVAFSSFGGTCFYNANLTNSNFTGSTLRNTNFRAAKLTHACWDKAKDLECSRIGSSILANKKVLELLTTRNGSNQDLSRLNLREANLDFVYLNGANLRNSDLSQARLHKADLQNSNLTEVQAIGTDFTESYLTGACLQSWNINQANITGIDCRFYFRREISDEKGNRDRRPHDLERIYEAGDVEKILTEAQNIVEVLLKNCNSFKDISQALQQVAETYSKAALKKVELMDDRDCLITLDVPHGTDRAQVENLFHTLYNSVQALHCETQELKSLSTNIKDIVADEWSNRQPIQVNFNQNIHQNVGEDTVSNQEIKAVTANSGSFINTGNISNSTNSLGDISGNVTNSLNQLAAQPQTQEIANLLQQFQTEIEADSNLPDVDKTDVLEQVSVLAEASKDPKSPENTTLVRRAMKLIKGTIEAVPKATTFIEACAKLLPLISKVFGI